MRPVALSLIAVGAALVLGTAAVASFYIYWRTEMIRTPPVYTTIHYNIWGGTMGAGVLDQTDPEKIIIEYGPYFNERREGHWILEVRTPAGSTKSDHWYREGQRITREEWERR